MAQPSKCTHGVDLDQDCNECDRESYDRMQKRSAQPKNGEVEDDDEDWEEEEDTDDLDEDEYDLGDEDELVDEDFEHPDTDEQKA